MTVVTESFLPPCITPGENAEPQRDLEWLELQQTVNHCLNVLCRFRRSRFPHSSQTFPVFHVLIRFFCPIFRVESNTFVIF